MSDKERVKFEELPLHIRNGLCDINFDLGVIKSALDDPQKFTDVEYVIRDRLQASLEILSELLV